MTYATVALPVFRAFPTLVSWETSGSPPLPSLHAVVDGSREGTGKLATVVRNAVGTVVMSVSTRHGASADGTLILYYHGRCSISASALGRIQS